MSFLFPSSSIPTCWLACAALPPDSRRRSAADRQEILTTKPEQKWSPQEHAGHLLDLEPLWLARVNDYVAAAAQLTPTDLQNRKTDEANHNARPLETILQDFRAAREKLLQRVAELDPSLFSRSIPHPRLKTPMRLVDHLYFVAEHDDHHLARIWELLDASQR